nr:VaFE repeat-containing surface-anchored protein [uncultured Schaedlerella sp.]
MGQFFAEPLPGKGKLKKVSAAPAITDGNGCYSLSGAVYTVYSDRGCSQRVGTLTTDGSGNSGTIELNEGSYYVKETTAPKGYQLNTQIHTLNVTTGGTAVLNVQDQPKVTNTLLELLKIDMELKDGIPQGAASLAGARFEWKYYAGYYTKENLPVNPTRTWVTQTRAEKDSAGKTHYVTALSDAYKVSGDAFYTQGGKAVLPLGTITVEEKQAPQGYLLEGAYLQENGASQKLTGLYVTQITESWNNASLTGANRYSVSDKVIRGGVKIQKRDLETKETQPQGRATLEGTEFSITNLSTHPVLVNNQLYEKGQVVLIVKTDQTGAVSTANNALPYGHYKIEETKPPKGYLNTTMEPIEFDITENGRIVDLSSEETSFYNQVIRGGVKIQKRDLETKKPEAQGGATLEHAEFSITTLSEHPVVVDGKAYSKGQSVVTITTDENGLASTEKDTLPYGHYKVEEIKAPEGYLKDGAKVLEFDILENEKFVELVSEESSIYNQVIRGDLEFVKISDGDMKRLSDVPFSITSKTTGESHTIVTDKNGYASTSSEWNKHTQNTNQGKTSEDGIWFGTVEPDDAKGALLYDTYTIEEQPCKTNEGMDLLKFEASVYRDSVTVDLGTLTDDIIEIGTTALDKESNTHMSAPKEKVIIVDTVEYSGLKKGQEYKIVGTLMNAEDGSPILIDGKEVTSEKSFKAKKSDGKVEVTFTFDATSLAGKTTVVFETLYQEDLKLAVHADIEDTDQQVAFPEIGTTAADSDTGENIANADETVILTDTIAYKGLIPEQEYTATGTLMDQETGEPILIHEKPVTAQADFTPDAIDGTVDVVFEFDGSGLKGRKTVIFESVAYEEKEVAVHADLSEEKQQMFFPEIGTKASCPETGSQMALPKKDLTIIDTVSYHLVPGKEYKLTGTLMDKETGEPLLVDEKPVISELTFTPEEAEGTVELSFTFDASALQGKTLVAFESVSYQGKEVAVHTDIEDEPQSIYFPEIGTKASCPETGSQTAPPKKDLTITDTVSYRLVPGKEYKLTGTLMDRETGEPLLVEGKPITSEKTFTPEESEGSVELSFTFDASGVDYPVVQGENNEYYLHYTFDRMENIAGSIFLDFRNRADFTDSKVILYGHNMQDGSMFSHLEKY